MGRSIDLSIHRWRVWIERLEVVHHGEHQGTDCEARTNVAELVVAELSTGWVDFAEAECDILEVEAVGPEVFVKEQEVTQDCSCRSDGRKTAWHEGCMFLVGVGQGSASRTNGRKNTRAAENDASSGTSREVLATSELVNIDSQTSKRKDDRRGEVALDFGLLHNLDYAGDCDGPPSSWCREETQEKRLDSSPISAVAVLPASSHMHLGCMS